MKIKNLLIFSLLQTIIPFVVTVVSFTSILFLNYKIEFLSHQLLDGYMYVVLFVLMWALTIAPPMNFLMGLTHRAFHVTSSDGRRIFHFLITQMVVLGPFIFLNLVGGGRALGILVLFLLPIFMLNMFFWFIFSRRFLDNNDKN